MKSIAVSCLVGTFLVPWFDAGAAAATASDTPDRKDRAAYEQAHREGLARFREACNTAGRSTPASTTRVPGIRLVVPPGALSFEQGATDRNWAFAGMPRERMGDRFIASFLDFTFGDSDLHADFGARTGMTVTMTGFQAVDVLQKDGTHVRYRLKGKSPSDGIVAEPVARDRAFRHVVSVEPLDIAGNRRHWVGGSRIRVVDSQTGQVMGEVRAVSFALPPEGVKASELDNRSWARSMSCPKYLDIQSAMTRVSLIGIVDPPRYSSGPASPASTSLEQAVEKGALKEATWADVDAWHAAVEAWRPKGAGPGIAAGSKSRATRSGEPFRSYVVLKALVLPQGLHGAHSAQFYVPKGVPRPTGDPGHSTVHDFNTMTCDGPDCRRQ